MKTTWMMLLVCLIVPAAFAANDAAPQGPPPGDTPPPQESPKPEQESGSPFSVTIKTEVWSKYIFEGFESSDDPVVQTDLYITLPKGFYFDVWHSVGLDDSDFSSDTADELDLTLGWEGELSENLGLNAGIIYYDLVDLLESRDDLMRAFVQFNTTVTLGGQEFTVYAQPEYNWTVNSDLEGGVGLEVGAAHSVQLHEAVTYDHVLRFFYDSGTAGLDAGVIAEYAGGFAWQATESIVVLPFQFKASTPLESLSDDRKTEFAFGAGVEFSF